MKCRICRNGGLKKILSLGQTPLANSFLSRDDLEKEEEKFPLEIFFCGNCKLVQLGIVVPAELMFRNYVYVSSTSGTFRMHFARMAEEISHSFRLDEKSLAVDIGSNDGILLKGFKKVNVQTIGVEPATNVAMIAEKDGIETINDFFGKKSVDEIIKRKGHADVVTAANVFAHIDDIHDVAENVKLLLKKDGIFVIEVQYLADMIEQMTFDNIYHEHLSYFALIPLSHFFKLHGMEVFDAKRADSHGGSLRVFIKKQGGSHAVKDAVAEILDYERKLGIDDFGMYAEFASKISNTKKEFAANIKMLKGRGSKIAAYGAPAKSTTLLNFCGIGADCIDYIIDDSPLKVGLYAPGTHIPVVSSKMLDDERPDYVVILAWNFAKEILEKTRKYAEQGVKFIVPLPEFRIV